MHEQGRNRGGVLFPLVMPLSLIDVIMSDISYCQPCTWISLGAILFCYIHQNKFFVSASCIQL